MLDAPQQASIVGVRVRQSRDRGGCGASAVEYALLIAGIAAVLVVVILLLGGKVQGLYGTTCQTLTGSGSCP